VTLALIAMSPPPCSKAAGNHEGLEAYTPQDQDPPAGIQGQPPDGAAWGVRGQRGVVADRQGALPSQRLRNASLRDYTSSRYKCKRGHRLIVLPLITCMAVSGNLLVHDFDLCGIGSMQQCRLNSTHHCMCDSSCTMTIGVYISDMVGISTENTRAHAVLQWVVASMT
jgi:hypothetical protein